MQAQVAVELVRVAVQAQEPAEVEIVRVAFAPASQAPVRFRTFASARESIRFRVDP